MQRSRGDDDDDIFAHLRLDGDILVGSGDGNMDVERFERAGCWRGVDHPRRAEAVDDHPEAGGPESLLKRHLHVPPSASAA